VRTEIMAVARKQAERFGTTDVLVATNSGASVGAAMAALGPGYRYYAVGNPASAHERGLVLHEGMSPVMVSELKASGVAVVLADRFVFQRPGLSLAGLTGIMNSIASWSEA